MKRIICVLAVMVIVVSSLFSANVSYRWRYVGEEEIECFEYKFMNSEWLKADKDQTKISFSICEDEANALNKDSFLIRSAIGQRKSVSVEGYPVIQTSKGTNSSISFAVLPLSIQFVTESKNDEYVVSKYGLGAEVAYQKYLYDFFYLNTGIQWNIFFHKDDKPNFNSMMEYVGFGYKLPVDEVSALFADLSIGCDTHFVDKVAASVLATVVNLGVERDVCQILSVKVSCRGVFEFSEKDDVNYANYRVLPAIAASFKF